MISRGGRVDGLNGVEGPRPGRAEGAGAVERGGVMAGRRGLGDLRRNEDHRDNQTEKMRQSE